MSYSLEYKDDDHCGYTNKGSYTLVNILF